MPDDLLIAWLNDAYAMESALIPILENHASDVQEDPAAHARIRQHADETRRHAERVKECVERLGSSTSATKTGFATLSGYMQSVSTGMFSDELVKNALMDYATEHFEIACYQALSAAAQQLGHPEIAAVCDEIMREERAMAEWLQGQLSTIVRQSVAQEAPKHRTAGGTT
jgi:ferritin-like metal-binding protein YciE